MRNFHLPYEYSSNTSDNMHFPSITPTGISPRGSLAAVPSLTPIIYTPCLVKLNVRHKYHWGGANKKRNWHALR